MRQVPAKTPGHTEGCRRAVSARDGTTERNEENKILFTNLIDVENRSTDGRDFATYWSICCDLLRPAQMMSRKKRLEPADQLRSTLCLFWVSIFLFLPAVESLATVTFPFVHKGSERSESQIELVSSTIVGRRRYVCIGPIYKKLENTVCD